MSGKQLKVINPLLSKEDIGEVIAGWTGIPLTKINETESDRLLNLEQTLHDRVIGQNDAVTSIKSGTPCSCRIERS